MWIARSDNADWGFRCGAVAVIAGCLTGEMAVLQWVVRMKCKLGM